MYLVTGGAGLHRFKPRRGTVSARHTRWSWSTGCARMSAGATSPATRSPTWCCRRRCRSGWSATAPGSMRCCTWVPTVRPPRRTSTCSSAQNIRATLDLAGLVHRTWQALHLRLLGCHLRRRQRRLRRRPGSGGAWPALLPLNAYGWSKHLIDRRIADLRERGAALPPQCVGLKFFNVYGPNEYHKGTMQSVVARNLPRGAARRAAAAVPERACPDYADGGQLRDFIYVQDCVDVMHVAARRARRSPGLYNVGTGSAAAGSDLARALFTRRAAPGGDRVH